MVSSSRHGITVALVVGLAACTSAAPTRSRDIASTALMTDRVSAGPDVGARYEYRKSPTAVAAYKAVRLEPVEVDRGADRRFDGLDDVEIRGLADRLGREVAGALRERGLLTERSGRDVLRLRLVLTSAQASVPGLATVTRVTPAGFVLNGVKSLGGAEGSFTGSAGYVAEFRDDATGDLVWAFVAKAYPLALDVPASVGRLTAAEAGIRRGAQALAKRLAGDLDARR